MPHQGLRLIKLLDFSHDEFGFSRLCVRDIDWKVLSLINAFKFSRKNLGGEVQAASCQAALPIAESRFDDQYGRE